MKGGVLLVAVGLFVGYLGVSGKYCCISQFFTCGTSTSAKPCDCGCTGEGGEVAANSYQKNFADLLRPLEVPGVQSFPYTFNLQSLTKG